MSASYDPAPVRATSGPEADYPVVVGEPFTVDGKLYTPSNSLNYDEVGFAALERDSFAGVTVAHKTLPMPSYVEITALDSGKTILARVERRGPMTSSRVVALSQGAASQLGVAEGAPVRVRRVNAPEIDRAKLRSGEAAPDRMETPSSLLTVLKRNLPESGSANLLPSKAAEQVEAPQLAEQAVELPEVATVVGEQAETAPVEIAQVEPQAEVEATPVTFDDAFAVAEVQPVHFVEEPLVQPVEAARAVAASTATADEVPASEAEADGNFVVQAAAFASKDNATRAAEAIGGFVETSGRFHRVRIGPFTSRGQAEAALAKARAAGYSDARVFTLG
ncbi:septal ring lytic transglycosylase RlpA family protein [Erythrobacter sp. HKB08]|uniref:septal ring lytic transglycosylase RlpA family protein n=1 Tax=Erythrobacter sp. HKB08 TaxID=2502843 RepID=UPI0013E8B03D|nr:SPOR domain-containing protein [Erythrobacter sp. HKB08]